MTEKSYLVGAEQFNLFIRYEYLRLIDARWQDHLENLDALREAVYLRTYSQKNPLLEYKLEGFQIFDEMLAGIRRSIAEKAFRVTIRTETGNASPDQLSRGARSQGVAALHHELGQFAAMQRPNDPNVRRTVSSTRSSSRRAASVTAGVQTNIPTGAGPALPISSDQEGTKKIGRNEPCHCGSGKKFKYCHGR